MDDTNHGPIEELGDYHDLHRWLDRKVPIGTLQVWVHRDIIPHVRLAPRTVRFSRQEIASWLKAKRGGPAATR